MTWDSSLVGAVATMAGALVGGAGVLFVKEKARVAAKQQFSEMIRGELATFKNEFGIWLNGRYIYANGTNLTGSEIKWRIEDAEEKISQHDGRLRTLESHRTNS